MSTTSQKPWPPSAIDAASHGAIAFTTIYYEAYDEPTRRSVEIPQFYLPSAKVIWNGNTVAADPASMAAFLDAMPLSRHNPQTLDCHPLKPLPSATATAPELLITITGSVLHGPTVMQYGDHAPTQPSEYPRKYREVFVLRAIESAEGMQPKYAIQSANFRFIG
ncbi:NTF2-like protein [Cutaneotrichosporon oleaginosum]|uniref:NTF2-like protein n=1 Tax=Cutaneotrichosporon oleaginosum TaxID=879819 RepID=A0A0J1AW00_9TREE|nr:NTF2-like protein [Cutaneotrichosporon oleaginosum]KLT39444.1 NTF2-like protein [Cutaneotrichosporon oleaginosum]TXT08450.1 hypothetical protein COLE_05374 [Cutaneotrichosporon oleaginosum]